MSESNSGNEKASTTRTLQCGCLSNEGIHLRRLELHHYRGFSALQNIQFAVPNGSPGSGLTVLVGENNSGKTSILEAIARSIPTYFNSFKPDERKSETIINIENCTGNILQGRFIGGGWYSNYNQANSPSQDEFPHIDGQILYIKSPRNWAARSGKNVTSENKIGFKQAFEEYALGLGDTFYDQLENNFPYILKLISWDRETKLRFNLIMRRLIPEFNDWSVLKKKLRYVAVYKLPDSSKHSSTMLGGGTLSLMKLIAVFLLERPVMLIDEPELGLHPQAQRKLAEYLSEISSQSQVVIATHSPHFINWLDLRNGAGLVRVNSDQRTNLREARNLSFDKKNFIRSNNENWQTPEKMDTVAKEIFFTRNIVFTEGKEDMSLLKSFIEQSRLQTNFDFFGYGSGGETEILKYLRLCKELGIKAGAIFDNNLKNKDIHYNNALSEFGEKFLIKQISQEDIRDKPAKYDSLGNIKHSAVVGIFKENGEIREEFRAEIRSLIDEFNAFFKK